VWLGGSEAIKYEELVRRAGWALVRDLDHLEDVLKM
jgi:hypothetical protein